jgi:hypothetical protein
MYKHNRTSVRFAERNQVDLIVMCTRSQCPGAVGASFEQVDTLIGGGGRCPIY